MLAAPALHLLLIAAAACCLYAPSLPGAFVLDDIPVIAENTNLDDPLAYIPVLGRLSGQTRSFGFFTFSLNHRLHGLSAEGYRAANIAIHIASALLVYFLVQNTVRSTGLREQKDTASRAGLIAGMLFAVHPVQTQAVTYLSQRFASLATLLCLLSVVSYGLWRSKNPLPDKGIGLKGIGWYALALISAFLAMKTKEISFTLPLMIVLYETIFFKGNRTARIVSLLPFLLLMLVIPLSLLSGQAAGTSTQNLLPAETIQISRHDYLVTQARVLATYGRLLLFPVNQNLDYDYPVLASLTIVSAGAILAKLLLFGAGILFVLRPFPETSKSPWPRVFGFGVFWFFLSLVVESSVIPIRDVIFEHRLYLPSVGFCLVVVAAVEQLGLRSPQLRQRLVAALSVMLVLLAALTIARNFIWRNSEALWSDVISKSPAKARPHNNLGLIYAESGRNEQALSEFRFAVERDPGFAEAHVNLGNELYTAGRLDEAAAAYEKAAELAPGFAKVHYNLGNLYLRIGRRGDAITAYEKALSLKPDYEKARKALEEARGK